MNAPTTFGPDATAIAFPLGGVGTGNVSVGSRGDLRDWELEGVAAKGTALANAMFGLWVRDGSGVQHARVLEGPLPVEPQRSHGYHPTTHAGVSRFEHSEFTGTYPTGVIRLSDPVIPVEIESTFFTPLVPLNAADSGLPVAVFDVAVTNTTDAAVDVSIAASMINPVGDVQHDPWGAPVATRFGRARNATYDREGLRGVVFDNASLGDDHLKYGQIALLTDCANGSIKPHWHRGGWWDEVRRFWQDFSEDGTLSDEGYTDLTAGKPDTGSVAAAQTINAHETATLRFYLAWFFPNRRNGWCAPENIPDVWDGESPIELTRTHYATRFSSATAVAQYASANRSTLDVATFALRDALHSGTLPTTISRPVSANILPYRSPTTFWLEDGGVYGWEGCFDDAGCCAGTCTHVWAYTYTGAYLFPELERRMRSIEFLAETDDDGYMYFRTHQTFGEEMIWQWGDRRPEPAIDGHMGSVIRAWREYCLSDDQAWLEMLWPAIKRAVDFACATWDADDDGIIDGPQHNTYDIEFWGPNPLAQFMFLAGLQAASRIAETLGHRDIAQLYTSRANRGTRAAGEVLWGGAFFSQPLDDLDEHPYQHGRGCLADQLLGDLHSQALGLDGLVKTDQRIQAYREILANNFRRGLRDHDNYQRVYANNAQAGLLQCTWPDKSAEPTLPFPYSDEIWPGSEYHVAAGMLLNGLVDEALQLLDATASRHDGFAANPWDEIECGHHYARSMSSWLVLLAATGQQTPAPGTLTFEPNESFYADGRFCAFYSDGRSWGTLAINDDGSALLTVLGGDRIPRHVTIRSTNQTVAVQDARIVTGPTLDSTPWRPTIPVTSCSQPGCC